MNGIIEWWPYAIGSPLQGGMLVALVALAVRTSPAWLTTWSAMRLAKSNANAARIAELEKQVKQCYDECSDVKREHAESLNTLREEHNEAMRLMNERLLGEQRQRIQEQVSLISAIMRSVDSPDLHKVLTTLESVQTVIKPERSDSQAMTASRGAVKDAAKTLTSTRETHEEVKRTEENGNGKPQGK